MFEKEAYEELDEYRGYPVDEDGQKYDPKERDPQYREIFEKVDKEVDGLLTYGGFGSCYERWRETKRILKEKHNIDWKTPEELNPLTLYD